MRRARLALCIAAGLVFGAFATASASAEAPEFGRCIKQVAVGKIYHGKFSDSKCTKGVSAEEEAKKGKYEWAPGPGANNQVTTEFGFVTLKTTGGKTLVCSEGGLGAGEVVSGTNDKELALTITFSRCGGAASVCTSPGNEPGKVTTNPLIVEAGWQDKAKKKTALQLRAAPGNEGFIAEFHCNGTEVAIRGAVLVPIKNDKMTSTEALKFKTNGKQVQIPDVWRVGEAGEASVFFEASFEKLGFEQQGFTSEGTLKAEEPIELNAIV